MRGAVCMLVSTCTLQTDCTFTKLKELIHVRTARQFIRRSCRPALCLPEGALFVAVFVAVSASWATHICLHCFGGTPEALGAGFAHGRSGAWGICARLTATGPRGGAAVGCNRKGTGKDEHTTKRTLPCWQSPPAGNCRQQQWPPDR